MEFLLLYGFVVVVGIDFFCFYGIVVGMELLLSLWNCCWYGAFVVVMKLLLFLSFFVGLVFLLLVCYNVHREIYFVSDPFCKEESFEMMTVFFLF